MHMIKRKCNMYMEAIKQSEDKGIMMGTTITIKLKGQSVIFFFFIFYYPSVSCFLLKNILVFLVSFLFYVVLLGYVHWRDRRYKGGAPIREEEDKQTQEREQFVVMWLCINYYSE